MSADAESDLIQTLSTNLRAAEKGYDDMGDAMILRAANLRAVAERLDLEAFQAEGLDPEPTRAELRELALAIVDRIRGLEVPAGTPLWKVTTETKWTPRAVLSFSADARAELEKAEATGAECAGLARVHLKTMVEKSQGGRHRHAWREILADMRDLLRAWVRLAGPKA